MKTEECMRQLKIVVVEDHTLLRQSLVRTLEADGGFHIVGEAGRGDEAVQTILRTKPDLVLLDISIPDGTGLDVATRLRAIAPDIRLLFLTMHEDETSISRAMGLGAEGYVVKTASTEELMTALHAVGAGEPYLSPAVARQVMHLAGPKSGTQFLTERELEILHLLARGSRPAEVGSQLFVSIKTVKNHLTSIYSKLGVHTGTQAVAEAYRRGLVVAELT